MADKRLVIIDSNSVIHRAFHALPPLNMKGGQQVNAVYGFLLVFFRAVRELKPDYLAACFDRPGPTFRHKKYKDYKANRPKAPQELYDQIPLTKDVLESFKVNVFEKDGFEADDIIATITEKVKGLPLDTIIISGDTDNLQLVGAQVRVYNLRKGVKDIVLYDEKSVEEKYNGLNPDKLLDLRALRGDSSDNIPGVKGIGEKTAISLISEFGKLESVYDNLALIPQKIREKLVKDREKAFLSKELSQMIKDVPFEFNLESCRFGNYSEEAVKKVLEKLEFFSLTARLPELKQKI